MGALHNEPPTEIEREAVMLRYSAAFPNAGAPPTPEQFENLLLEIRERKQAIEQSAIDMLRRETRNPPSRGFYSKHMRLFMIILFIAFAVSLMASLIGGWLSRS